MIFEFTDNAGAATCHDCGNTGGAGASCLVEVVGRIFVCDGCLAARFKHLLVGDVPFRPNRTAPLSSKMPLEEFLPQFTARIAQADPEIQAFAEYLEHRRDHMSPRESFRATFSLMAHLGMLEKVLNA